MAACKIDPSHGRRPRRRYPPLSQSPQLLSIPQFYFPQLGPQPEVQRAAEERLMALLGAHPQVTSGVLQMLPVLWL